MRGSTLTTALLIACSFTAVEAVAAGEKANWWIEWIAENKKFDCVRLVQTTVGRPVIEGKNDTTQVRFDDTILMRWPDGLRFVQEQYRSPTPIENSLSSGTTKPLADWKREMVFLRVFRPDATLFSGTPDDLIQTPEPMLFAEGAWPHSEFQPWLVARLIDSTPNQDRIVETGKGTVSITIKGTGQRFQLTNEGPLGPRLIRLEKGVHHGVAEEVFEFDDFRAVPGIAVVVPFKRTNWWRRETFDIHSKHSTIDDKITRGSETLVKSIDFPTRLDNSMFVVPTEFKKSTSSEIAIPKDPPMAKSSSAAHDSKPPTAGKMTPSSESSSPSSTTSHLPWYLGAFGVASIFGAVVLRHRRSGF